MEREENGWKFLMLLPRMLLYKLPTGGGIPKHKLLERFDMFNWGQWEALLAASCLCRAQAAVGRRRWRSQGDNISGRVERAEALVHLGELSSARQVLEGAQLAPGSRKKWQKLIDQSKNLGRRVFTSGPNWSIDPAESSIWTALCSCGT